MLVNPYFIKLFLKAWAGKEAIEAMDDVKKEKEFKKYSDLINSLPEGEKKEFVRIANEQGPEALVNYFKEKVGDTTNIPQNIQDLNTRFVNYAKTGEPGKGNANFNIPVIRTLSEMPPAKLYTEYERIRTSLEETIPDKGRTYKDAFQNPTKEEAERIKGIYKELEVLNRYAKLYDKLSSHAANNYFNDEDRAALSELTERIKNHGELMFDGTYYTGLKVRANEKLNEFVETNDGKKSYKIDFDKTNKDIPKSGYFTVDADYAGMSQSPFLNPGESRDGSRFYDSVLNPQKEGLEQTVFYNGKNGVVAFTNMLELQNHMLKNSPNMLVDGSKVSEIMGNDRLTDKDKIAQINKLDESNIVTGSIKENISVTKADLFMFEGIYDKTKNPSTKKGGPSFSKGYLQAGEYMSDDYNPAGDEAGYTGKAKKVAVSGQTFNPNDPSTYKWQYELKGQRRNDGTLVPGTEEQYFWQDAGEVDEDAYSVFKEPTQTPKQVNVEKDKKMGIELGNFLTLLKGGAGLIGLGKAMKDIPIGENQELSESFKAYMRKMKEVSESGLTAKEKASIKTDLSNAYNLGAKNVLRASAGSRGTFLSNMGMLNANRVNALIKMGEVDAKMQRENMANYGKMLTFQEKYKADQGLIGRQMAYKENLRKSNLYGSLGSSLIGSALSDLSYAEQMKNMTPYMDQWAKNIGLTSALSDAEGDAADDSAYYLTND